MTLLGVATSPWPRSRSPPSSGCSRTAVVLQPAQEVRPLTW